MLARIRKTQQENEGGFTLIELLVVIIIIGILAAIAIPTFLNQRKKGWDSAAKSALKNAATAQESWNTDNSSYTSTLANLVSEGYNATANVTLSPSAGTGTTATQYCMSAFHTSNSSKIWYLGSAAGSTAPSTTAC